MNGTPPPVEEQDHAQGPETAEVTLIEYGDYECSYCGQAYRIIQEIRRAMGPRLRFVFRNFPLQQMHPHAELAAEAAEAAGAQGKFWEMHDALYENQDFLGPYVILGLAERLGLDANRFVEDLRSRKFRERVRQDFTRGARSGVNGTPGFFINGERYDGASDYDALLAHLRGRRAA